MHFLSAVLIFGLVLFGRGLKLEAVVWETCLSCALVTVAWILGPWNGLDHAFLSLLKNMCNSCSELPGLQSFPLPPLLLGSLKGRNALSCLPRGMVSLLSRLAQVRGVPCPLLTSPWSASFPLSLVFWRIFMTFNFLKVRSNWGDQFATGLQYCVSFRGTVSYPSMSISPTTR